MQKQAPDLLIIDHYGPFTKDTNANQNQSDFDALIKELFSRYPGIAILFLHQANKEGGIRGDLSTFNNASVILEVRRLTDSECEAEGLPQKTTEVFKLIAQLAVKVNCVAWICFNFCVRFNSVRNV